LPTEVKIEVQQRRDDIVKRKWKIEIEPGKVASIESGREAYVTWLKRVNNTANKEVWKIYDHLASDILHDIMGELMSKIDKDLDQYCEKVIYDEF